MRKTTIVLVTLLLLCTTVTACGVLPEAKREMPPVQTPPGRTLPAEQTDSGRYVGQIDSNSIEIKISGVPDDKAARAFRLSDDLKTTLPKMGLTKDQNVKFTYFVNADGQSIITSIEKM